MSDIDRKWLALVEEQWRCRDIGLAQEELTMAAMLTGEECHIFGRRVRIRLEWVDDAPMTDDQLRDYGERVKARALAQMERIGAAH